MKQTVSGGEAMPEHKKPLKVFQETFCAMKRLFPFGASYPSQHMASRKKFTYQPTLAYSRRLP
jgi:hypothetical protein